MVLSRASRTAGAWRMTRAWRDCGPRQVCARRNNSRPLQPIAIRAPYGQRSTKVKVLQSHRTRLEVILLTIAWVSFFVPLLWVATSWFAWADYPLRSVPYAAGLACYSLGLWVFLRSHRDLGDAWSITLELREGQRVVSQGVYARIRHPMYLGLLDYSVGQALVLPNWVAGPSYLVSMGLLVALRLGPEERMMREKFGAEYVAYCARTKRLFAGLG